MQRKTYLGGKRFIANGAFVGAFLGVAAVVDLKCRLARERLHADLARGVAANACREQPEHIIVAKFCIHLREHARDLCVMNNWLQISFEFIVEYRSMAVV